MKLGRALIPPYHFDEMENTSLIKGYEINKTLIYFSLLNMFHTFHYAYFMIREPAKNSFGYKMGCKGCKMSSLGQLFTRSDLDFDCNITWKNNITGRLIGIV